MSELPAPVRVHPAVMPGDYVLATKYRDGDSQDQWCVGFYKESYLHCETERYIVVDNIGQSFRGNGFRRVKKILKERGAWMLQHAKEIETSGKSVWWYFAGCSMRGHNA